MLKIFIRKWLFLFLITLSNLIIALKTHHIIFHFFFWFLISVIMLSLLCIAVMYIGVRLSLKRSIPGRIDEDDILDVELAVKNNSFLPVFNLVLEESLPCALPQEKRKHILLEFLKPKSTINIKYSCLCPLRGKYEIGPLRIYFFDPFGVFFFKRAYHLRSELYIYPRTFKVHKFPHLVKGVLPWFGIDTTHVSGDEDEFYGVREYKEGDPIQRIHWISTARKNKLIVKQFQRQSFFRATIVFNLEKDKNYGEGKESVAEYIIKIAASVARHLIERGISLEIIAHAQETVHIPFNKGQEHLDDVFKFLTVAQAESKVGIGEIFEEFSKYIPDYSNLIVIMLDEDWEHFPAILSMAKRNISLVPLILISSTFLYPFQKQGAVRDAEVDLSQALNLIPTFFSCGENLEEAFLRR